MGIKQLIENNRTEIQNLKIETAEQAEEFRNKYLSPKGVLKSMFQEMKNVPAEERKEAGLLLNEFKQYVESTYEPLKRIIVEAPKIIPSISSPTKIVVQGEKVTVAIKTPAPVHEAKEIVIPTPSYKPGELFWTMIGEKPVECKISKIVTEHTVREYTLSYESYFKRSDLGIEVAGMPDLAPITRKENKMFKTKELLLSSL